MNFTEWQAQYGAQMGLPPVPAQTEIVSGSVHRSAVESENLAAYAVGFGAAYAGTRVWLSGMSEDERARHTVPIRYVLRWLFFVVGWIWLTNMAWAYGGPWAGTGFLIALLVTFGLAARSTSRRYSGD